jgi:two-component system, OmpR family, phosphate regulon response regulator PhoB
MPPDKKRVLCAEPSEDICDLVTLMLGRSGYEVVNARTIHDCLELARKEQFDLYMLDDDYIDGNSIELCKQLRALTPETPILFFSTAAFERDRQRGLDAGAHAYLTKPDDIFEIVQTINSILLPSRARSVSNDADQP